MILFASVLIINTSYFCLSISGTLAGALNANRVAYLGSVFLPLSMMMIILKVCNQKYPKWLPAALAFVAVGVFLIAASPGILDIYYKEVCLDTSGGFTTLRKVYGSWHFIYLVYLFGYFAAMIAVITRAFAEKKIVIISHSIILATAVFVNIGVWFVEQLIEIPFEILSVSYIISELFLLGLHILMNEQEKLLAIRAQAESIPTEKIAPPPAPEALSAEQTEIFVNGVAALTPTEKTIFNLYIEQKSTKEIMEQLNIKENTLKFHNKNIYGKLGVSSRKQLMAIYSDLNRE